MKTKITLFIVIVSVLAMATVAQNEPPVAHLKTVGRYVPGKGIELRFFPDKRDILYLGLTNGFVIERQFRSAGGFTVIDTVRPFTEAQWTEAIGTSTGEEALGNLELAKDFFDEIPNPQGGTFSFEEGIAGLKQQKSQEDFEFMVFVLTAVRDKTVAGALGLSYFDQRVLAGENYAYRVRVIGSSPVYQVLSLPFVIQATEKQNSFQQEVYTRVLDSKLSFTWEASNELTGFDVERANPGDAKFIMLNDAPLYSLVGKGYEGPKRCSFLDENLVNYQTYTYRFYGRTVFGDRIQFAEIKAMPRDLTPPRAPILFQPSQVKQAEVMIIWKTQEPVDPDLKGFVVARSQESQGAFKVLHETLLPKDARTFIDRSFLADGTNYYVVQAIDTANNISSSFPVAVALVDSTPPEKPVILAGTVDSAGIVTLAVGNNTEKDLMGYRIYQANSPDHEFSVIFEGFRDSDSSLQIVQTTFHDTISLNSLTASVFYRVKALDFHFNQSEFSEVIKIDRPDTIPPSTPVFTSVRARENEIELGFALSESEDVIEHILYRRTDPQADWDSIASLGHGQTLFTDQDVVRGHTYHYSLRAKDKHNLYSDFAFSVVGSPYDSGIRPRVDALSIHEIDKHAMLTWKYDALDDQTFFVIYKKNDGGDLKQYARSVSLDFKDQLEVAESQSYAVMVLTKDGGQSEISEVVTLRAE